MLSAFKSSLEKKSDETTSKPKRQQLAYEERIQYTENPLTKRLFEIMTAKRSNLCVAADVKTKAELLALVKAIGPYICVLKTHIDITEGFDEDLIAQLVALSEEHNFLIFEDRKFADIGNTVALQYTGGVHKIVEWAHVINAHTISGPDIISELNKAKGNREDRGLLLLAEMSSKGNLFTPEYTQKTVAMAEAAKSFVIGFISMGGLSDEPSLLHMTPGINAASQSDGKGQQWVTPEVAINKGSDIIIVGRGIYQDIAKAADNAKAYKEAGWAAYEANLANALLEKTKHSDTLQLSV
jgi:orotidine 5'-phosphate decarboxylase subfamily 1